MKACNALRMAIFLFTLFSAWQAEGVVKNNLVQIISASPGQEIPLKITLGNDSDKESLYHCSLCDYQSNSTGESFYLPANSLPRSSTSWIQLSNETFSLPPRGDQDLYGTIRVPNDSKLKGSYCSILLIEPEEAHPLHTPPPGEEGITLLVKIRYACQLIINIGAGEVRLKIEKQAIALMDNSQKLTIDVVNNGEVYIAADVALKLFDKQGQFINELKAGMQRLFPGSSTRCIIDINDLKKGDYIGFLLLDAGQGQVFGERISFAVP
jgi:hypothetical protein